MVFHNTIIIFYKHLEIDSENFHFLEQSSIKKLNIYKQKFPTNAKISKKCKRKTKLVN